jgi:hypothetical protein
MSGAAPAPAGSAAYPNLWRPGMRHDEQKVIFAIL